MNVHDLLMKLDIAISEGARVEIYDVIDLIVSDVCREFEQSMNDHNMGSITYSVMADVSNYYKDNYVI